MAKIIFEAKPSGKDASNISTDNIDINDVDANDDKDMIALMLNGMEMLCFLIIVVNQI